MHKKLLFYLGILPLALVQLSVSANYSKLGFVEKGKASYYGEKFQGKPTASGEPFSVYLPTAAHKFVPFQSLVQITNLKNNKTVTLRVNDRGPFSPNRIVDVSKAAAEELDMLHSGVIDVEMKILRVGKVGEEIKSQKKELPKPIEKESKKADKEKKKKKKRTTTYTLWGVPQKMDGYGVQVGNYADLENAAQIGTKLMDKGHKEVYIQAGWVGGSTRIFKLMVGQGSKEQMNILRKELDKKGYTDCFVKQHLSELE